MATHRLAIFDIDGTIAVKGKIPPEILEGFRHLQEQGYLTTVSTGRGYARAKELLGENFSTIISPGSFMLVEHGAKIVDHDGKVMRADYFRPNELDHVADFCASNRNMLRRIRLMPPDPAERIQIWCQYPEDVAKETEKSGYYADVFHSSFEELRQCLDAFPISNASAYLEPFIAVENLKLHFTRSEIDVIFQDGLMEFIRNIADKAKAVQFLESHFEVPVSQMLLAGNAINDVDMLNLEAGTRVLVGEGPATDTVLGHLKNVEQVVRVDSPAGLGMYLQTLA